jgi:hypothetical protein
VRPKRQPNAKLAVKVDADDVIDDIVATMLDYDRER